MFHLTNYNVLTTKILIWKLLSIKLISAEFDQKRREMGKQLENEYATQKNISDRCVNCSFTILKSLR